MKKTIFIITGLFILLQWGCRLEELTTTVPIETQNLQPRDIISMPNGNYMICGITGEMDDDIFLMEIDNNCNQISLTVDKRPGTSEKCNSITMATGGGFIVCGERESQGYISKYDASGSRVGEVTVSDLFKCNCVIDGENANTYAFVGQVLGTNGVSNTYVGVLESQGTALTILNEYKPTPPNTEGQEAFSIVLADNGDYVVSGRSNSLDPLTGNTNAALHFYRLNDNLVLQAEILRHIGNQQDIGHAIAKTDNNQYMITGNVNIPTEGRKVFAHRVNKDGAEVYLSHYFSGNIGSDQGLDIINANTSSSAGQDYILTGYDGTPDGEQLYLLKIRANTSLLWQETFGEPGADHVGQAVVATPDGYIVVGYSLKDGVHSPMIIKVDEDGNIQ